MNLAFSWAGVANIVNDVAALIIWAFFVFAFALCSKKWFPRFYMLAFEKSINLKIKDLDKEGRLVLRENGRVSVAPRKEIGYNIANDAHVGDKQQLVINEIKKTCDQRTNDVLLLVSKGDRIASHRDAYNNVKNNNGTLAEFYLHVLTTINKSWNTDQTNELCRIFHELEQKGAIYPHIARWLLKKLY